MNIYDDVVDFYNLAVEYCDWAEDGPSENDAVIALDFLASLYHLALRLPETEPTDEELGELKEEGITKLNSVHIYERFKGLPFQYYHEIFHPLKDTEPVQGDIADDLMDIYIDLKEGILLYEKERKNDAIFEWRVSFGFHWGRHATDALKALHSYIVDNEDYEP